MRFRFCGDLDCPDWILAEISTLSRISSVKMKLLCSQVASDLLGSGIDYEKIVKLTTDAKYDASDVKAAVAVLAFILTSATKYGVDEESLSSELQQLGLPKEHTGALCKVYAEKFVSLQDNFRRQSLKFTSLDEIHWRVDYLLSSSELKQINQPVVQLCMAVREQQSKSYAFSMTAEKFRVLLYELKQAYHMMETVG